LILQAYQLFKDIIKNTNYSRFKLPYLMVQLNGKPKEIVEFNFLTKYEVLSYRKIGNGNIIKKKTMTEDVRNCNLIRKIRRIFYDRTIKEIIEILGDRSGLETTEISKQDRAFLKNSLTKKVYDQVMATLVRLNH